MGEPYAEALPERASNATLAGVFRANQQGERRMREGKGKARQGQEQVDGFLPIAILVWRGARAGVPAETPNVKLAFDEQRWSRQKADAPCCFVDPSGYSGLSSSGLG